MKRSTFVLMLLFVCLFACKKQPPASSEEGSTHPERAASTAEASPKKTKLETFATKYGVVVVQGFTEIGHVAGQYGGHVGIGASEYININTGEKQRGVSILVKEGGSLEREGTSYVDYDEIESLLKGIDYIAKASHSLTKLQQFQANYATRGDFVISTFSTETSGLMASVASGRIAGAHVFISHDSLESLRGHIASAKVTLDSIDAVPSKK